MADEVVRGDLVSFTGPWSFQIGKSAIILVSDRELEALSDPDRVLNLTLTFEKQEASLRQVCERAKAAGHRTLIVAFDHFFSQYRPGQAGPRTLMPDMDEYIRRIAAIGKFAEGYGLGLELSLLSPLEIGPAYARETGESGIWLHYREGYRNPVSGAYSVQLWRQKEWVNNKGPVRIEDAGVRVFAFHETRVPGTESRAVDPAEIEEVTDGAAVEILGAEGAAERIRVHGSAKSKRDGLDRVLVVQQYRTPEMDYFSEKAPAFLRNLIDRYADAGVKLNALYSDEMHIQQDWDYFGHHDHGEFALRYVSPGLAKRFADRYGEEYRDFAKFMVFFATGQEDFARDLSAKESVSHVFGASPEAIRKTALFRARYYRLLHDGVVELFVGAKRHAERRMGRRLEARAHATWAESPTIDRWRTGADPMFRHAYEYTSNFVWSNTVHQSASACDDYFRWGDFLTGNGNDHAEGGWTDRNYYGLTLACSTGILNDIPYSYAAHWGMPEELSRRRSHLVNAYGAAGSPLFGMVQGMAHRHVDALMLYPLNLVAVEERFGSWMTQYGYANLITAEKLLERGRVVAGGIEVAGRRFTTLAALFEPFPSRALLAKMKEMAEAGGCVIWSGSPPLLSWEGEAILPEWEALFGVEYEPLREEGRRAPGREIRFEGTLRAVPPQTVLTDFLVDRLYPVTPRTGAEAVARSKEDVVGTHRVLPGGGSVTFLGFRPRDDQSASLGYEMRTWYETLHALGAYPSSDRWRETTGPGDNTETLSRATPYLCCRFPNGAVAVAPHFRSVKEGWPGGFARSREEDAEIVKRLSLPSESVDLKAFRVNGHEVTYRGTGAMTFRVDGRGRLIAFAGGGCRSILIDGRETVFADREVAQVGWAPVEKEQSVPGGAALRMMVHGEAEMRIPAPGIAGEVELYAEGPTPGSRGERIDSRRDGDALVFTVTPKESGRWLFTVPSGRTDR